MTSDRHRVAYKVLNRHEALHYPPEFEVHATPEELAEDLYFRNAERWYPGL